MAKVFPAKYDGICKRCGMPFWAGESITRHPEGWGHAECPDEDEFPARLTEFVLREARQGKRWETIRRYARKEGLGIDGYMERISLAFPRWAEEYIDWISEDVRNRMVAEAMARAAREHLGREVSPEALLDLSWEGEQLFHEVSEALREAGIHLNDVRRAAREARKAKRAELEETAQRAMEEAARRFWEEQA